MIVKNEGHCLGRCLKSAQDCVDEIIVVDTGSSDDTVKIAEQFGAKVFYYQWQDDFGAARNFSLDQATGDWALYLDADEELPPNSCQRIRALAEIDSAEGYYFTINNFSDQGEDIKHINVRMFRNKHQYRFKGKLHEQIADGMALYNSGITIWHYGYLTSEWEGKNKAERNYRINQQMVAQHPEDPFYLYNLGTACYNLNDIKGAADNYHQALQHLDLKANYAPSVFISYVSCQLKLGNLKEALKYISQCRAHFPEYVDIYFLAGELYKVIGAVNESIECYEKCLALGENPSGKYTSQTGVGSFKPCFRLAEIYHSQGDLKQAISFQLRGIKASPTDTEQLTVLAKLLKEMDKELSQNSISLCIIAKNEAHNIARCINSAKPFVDQIVVVDTGSTDNTAEIAKQLGAEIYQFDWQDDFSQARNYSLQFATGDWILFLDCDEELDAETGAELRTVICNDNYDGYWLNYINIYNNHPSSNFISCRLFRNNPKFRFECPIHEQILPSILKHSNIARIGQANVTVYHYGYEDSEVIAKNKSQRNISLLQKAQQEYGNAGFINFYLGVEYQRIGEYQKAIDHYELSLAKSTTDDPYTPAMIRNIVHCYINLNQHQDGLQLIDQYLQVYPDYTDLVYLKGALYYQLDDYQNALIALNQCIAIGPPPKHYLSLQGIADAKPLDLIHKIIKALILQGKNLIDQGYHTQGYNILDQAFNQLKNTPDKNLFIQLMDVMLS
jgi:glycosyltransferase involved in cell wall biosynthesis